MWKVHFLQRYILLQDVVWSVPSVTYLILNSFNCRFPSFYGVLNIIWCTWQVIIGTIIGIYKPSAVSVAIFVHFLILEFQTWLDWSVWFKMQVTWLQTDLFTVGLGFLMLSMGLTLTFEDFRRCLRNPWTVWLSCFSFLCLGQVVWRGWVKKDTLCACRIWLT